MIGDPITVAVNLGILLDGLTALDSGGQIGLTHQDKPGLFTGLTVDGVSSTRTSTWTPWGGPRMVGQTICRMHGGRTPQALAASHRRAEDAEAKAAMATTGPPMDISPCDALVDEVRRTPGRAF